MAAIDKMYVNDYSALVELKKWAMSYYPKLLIYIPDWAFNVTKKEFEEAQLEFAKRAQKAYKDDWDRISSDGTINCAIAYILREWDGWNEEDATIEAKRLKSYANMSIEELKEEIDFPILHTPMRVDRKLKWICPLSSVRIYLQTHCGVKEHWWYKLFWRGRRDFHYYF